MTISLSGAWRGDLARQLHAGDQRGDVVGLESELVRIRGFAGGSAERSHTRPRASGLISTGRDGRSRAPSNSSRRGPRSRRRPCGTGCRRRAGPARVRTKATTSATVEVSGPDAAQQPFGEVLRACRRRRGWARPRPPRASSRTGGPGGCARRRAGRGATAIADLAQVVGRADARQQQELRRADRARRRGSPRARPARAGSLPRLRR